MTIPVAGPVDQDWAVLRQRLAACWAQTTSLANWAVTELLKADVVRTPDLQKLPTMPSIYLYPSARKRFPELATQTVVSLLHTVEQRYRKHRLQVLWTAEESLQCYRYPVPYPVHNKGWKLRLTEPGVFVVDVPLGGGERLPIRLRGGPQFKRHRKALEQIVSGQAVQGEFSLYRQRSNSSDHRQGVEDREPGGGQRATYRVMAKLVAWFPRVPESEQKGPPLEVHTATDSFLVAVSNNRDPWILNADHVRRWIAAYRKRTQRLAEDLKFEKRWPKRNRHMMANYRDKIAVRHQRRIDSFIHETTALVVSYAARMRAREVHYNDTDRAYVPSFPWFKLRETLSSKLADRQISFIVASDRSNNDEGQVQEAA